jgi:hypothetical protein
MLNSKAFMSKTSSFASLAIGAAALGFIASPASAITIGNSVGPYQTINITNGPGGTLQAAFVNGSLTAYDTGDDDVFYSVVNNSTQRVVNVTLSGTGIFGFEVDGIGAGPVYPGAGGCGTTAPCTTPAAGDNSGGGYGGPISSFLLTNTSLGSVLFGSGLNPGDSTIFALEAPAAQISVTGINTVPLPAALPLFAGGLGVMGLFARRRKRKAAQA